MVASVVNDEWGRPTAKIKIMGSFGKIEQSMLVDTGTCTSLLCLKGNTTAKNLPVRELKSLVSYNGKENIIPFTYDVTCHIGSLSTQTSFGLQKLDGTGIIGINLLQRLDITIDLPNRMLIQAKHGEAGILIPATHPICAAKAPEELRFPVWETEIQQVINKYKEVFAPNELSCGKVQASIKVESPNANPIHQYRYSAEMKEGIRPTVKALLNQKVLIPCQSVCNSPIWPVRKADGRSWRLTVDYRGLNKVTPRLAPVAAKFPEVMNLITEGACWNSILDISNAFFSIPLHPSCYYKFAFTYEEQQVTFTRVP